MQIVTNNKGNGFSQKNAQQQKDNPEKDYPGSITKRQIGKIRYSLKERNIPENVFCFALTHCWHSRMRRESFAR